jgi:hypothetical protein
VIRRKCVLYKKRGQSCPGSTGRLCAETGGKLPRLDGGDHVQKPEAKLPPAQLRNNGAVYCYGCSSWLSA